MSKKDCTNILSVRDQDKIDSPKTDWELIATLAIFVITILIVTIVLWTTEIKVWPINVP